MTVTFCGRTAASVGIGSSPSNRKERGVAGVSEGCFVRNRTLLASQQENPLS